MKEIPLSVPNLHADIIDNLTACIKTGWISTGGSYIKQFEEKLAKYLGVNEVVGVQSGTAALHLVYQYFNFKDCEVICPTVTFVASVNPLLYVGAHPVFMDCDDTLNMDLEKLEDFCFHECELIDGKLINKKSRKHVKGIVVVHVLGNPVDMERVMDIAEVYHLTVVEDAAEALGTYYTKGRYKGCYCGTIGDAGVYSFNANKIVTTGGGGAITSKNLDLLYKARYWSVQSKASSTDFIHDEVGYNYRMLNLNAAIGVSQLTHLEEFIKIKQANYELYKKEIDKIPGLSLLSYDELARSNKWFYSLLVDETVYPESKDALFKRLQEKGIQTRPLWGLMHEQKHLRGYESYKIDKAYYYHDHLLNIPCSSNLSKEEILSVVDVLEQHEEVLVSIITPVYNSEKYLKDTIESVLNQTYQNFEMICVDDASTDNSAQIIKTYQKTDDRIKYYRLENNSGAAVARNVALEKSKGNYIAFLDSDDIWHEDKLKKQVQFMRQNKVAFSFTAYQMMNEAGCLYKRSVNAPEKMTYNGLLRNTIIGCLTVMIDRNLVGEMKMPLVRDSQDYATWLKILKRGFVAYGINENLATYRKVNGSISHNKLKALRSNWLIYRQMEHLSFIRSLYVFCFYVLHALRKHILVR